MHDHLSKIGHCRFLLGSASAITISLYGGPADIAARGKLQGRWLAKIAVEWLSKHADVRHVPTAPPQSMLIISENRNRNVLTATCRFTTVGLGVPPGDRLGLVQLSDTVVEAEAFADWFQHTW